MTGIRSPHDDASPVCSGHRQLRNTVDKSWIVCISIPLDASIAAISFPESLHETVYYNTTASDLVAVRTASQRLGELVGRHGFSGHVEEDEPV